MYITFVINDNEIIKIKQINFKFDITYINSRLITEKDVELNLKEISIFVDFEQRIYI